MLSNSKIAFLILFYFLAPFCTNAQKVENLRFEQVGKQIIIYYDLTGTQPGQTYDIEVFCSTDRGKTFGIPLKHLTGDAGIKISGGSNKKIAWNVLEEREVLTGDVVIEVQIKNSLKIGSLKDLRDGKSYTTVKIGTQTWLSENLNYATSSGSFCYNESSTNCLKYGRLYNWETAKQVCPTGWHLPSDTEWATLVTYLGGENLAGGKLKSLNMWNSPNTGATNGCGFSALPGGNRYEYGAYDLVGSYSFWWSSSESNSDNGWSRSIYHNYPDIIRNNYSKLYCFSVRCIKD